MSFYIGGRMKFEISEENVGAITLSCFIAEGMKAPDALPSNLCGDASHPLAEEYAILGRSSLQIS